jgi:hypothetical protein
VYVTVKKIEHRHTAPLHTFRMPYYFGYTPRANRPIATAVTIKGETYEPAEPSRIKLFPMIAAHSILTSTWASLVGLLTAVLSMATGSSVAFTAEGAIPEVSTSPLPFRSVGLAFSLKKGFVMDQTTESELAKRGFTTMVFNKNQIYSKNPASKDDYQYVEKNVPMIDETRQVPNRFLNPAAFRSVLILGNLTSVICQTLHRACEGDGDDLRGKGPEILEASTIGGDEVMEVDNAPATVVASTVDAISKKLKKKSPEEAVLGRTTWLKFIKQVLVFKSDNDLSYTTPARVINPYLHSCTSFISSGDYDTIDSHGLIMKFIPALAVPDVNSVTDVLARHFMRLLGDDQEEQHELLCELKRGVGLLRLSRLGDELAHLYRCIDLSIDCRCGLVPFFSGTTYEGAVLMGGEGCRISWPREDKTISFLPADELKADFRHASSHTIALTEIAEVFPESSRLSIRNSTSMMGLRELCLVTKLSTDEVEFVVGRAADLTYSTDPHWVVNPANIKKAMKLISGETALDPQVPITRHCLFSKDPVLLGLSVFGEESVPSWNIPSGTLKSLKGAPPRAPDSREGQYGKMKGGVISDADWSMTIRRTTLKNAVDDFRELARLGGYRAIASTLARKQGYYSFGSDRMIEFWAAMQVAYRSVDPLFVVHAGEGVIAKAGTKRADRDSNDSAKERSVKKARF